MKQKITLTKTYTVPYSFTDKKGVEIKGESYYAMLITGYGSPTVVKTTQPLFDDVFYDDMKELIYDYKQRIVV